MPQPQSNMNPWLIVELAVFAGGVLVALAGQRLDDASLTYLGIALCGGAGVVIGLEAIIKRRVVLPSRYYRYGSETYLGIAAFAQGIQLILIGGFLIDMAMHAYRDTARAAFLAMVRHPGGALLTFGVLCLSAAVIAIVGYAEQTQAPRFVVALQAIASRLLPGALLIALALAAFGLGVLELAAPETFDQLGGGFLEVLFGAALTDAGP